MDKSSSGPSVGEVGGTGDESESGPPQSGSKSACDACEGCDDVCGSKLCENCKRKCLKIASEGPNCPYGFTKCQVRRHNQREDCWLIAHRRVYNATKFIDSHPAGPDPILRRAGGDASIDYDFHSSVSQKLYWKPLCIGRVVRCPYQDRESPASFSESSCTIQ